MTRVEHAFRRAAESFLGCVAALAAEEKVNVPQALKRASKERPDMARLKACSTRALTTDFKLAHYWTAAVVPAA